MGGWISWDEILWISWDGILWMDGMNGWIDRWIDKQMNEQIRWMDEWIHGWRDEWIGMIDKRGAGGGWMDDQM